MADRSTEGDFDCVKWTREVRDQVSAEIAGMSFEELRAYLDQVMRDNPHFAGIKKAKMAARPSLKRSDSA